MAAAAAVAEEAEVEAEEGRRRRRPRRGILVGPRVGSDALGAELTIEVIGGRELRGGVVERRAAREQVEVAPAVVDEERIVVLFPRE